MNKNENENKVKAKKNPELKEKGVKALGTICSAAGSLIFGTGLCGVLPMPGMKKSGGSSVPPVGGSFHGGQHIHM